MKKGKRKEQERLWRHRKTAAGGPTLLPGESHDARGAQQLFFFKEKKNLPNGNFLQISSTATNFTSCSHKHAIFPTGNAHRSLSLPSSLNNMLQIPCK